MGNFVDYRKEDLTNGEGVRVSVFVSGCSLRCKGCWNPFSWNPRNGKPINETFIKQVIQDCDKSYINGLSILGGEPTENLDSLNLLVDKFREKFSTDKTIWVWSGFTLDEIKKDEKKLNFIKKCDVLIEGRFILEERDLSLKYRGSKNQKVLDIQKSLSQNRKVEFID